MQRQISQGIIRVIVYELHLPWDAGEWCRQQGFAYEKREELDRHESIRPFLVIRFECRKAARRVARAFDLAHNNIPWRGGL